MAAKLKEWDETDRLPMSYTRWNKQNPESDPEQCGKRRADLTYEQVDQRVLQKEYDENAHRQYALSCELAKNTDMALGFGGRPVRIIRYNPDNIRIRKVMQNIPEKEREVLLLQRMQYALGKESAVEDFEYFLTIEFLFYYPVPGTVLIGENLQIIRFRDTVEYEAWASMWLVMGRKIVMNPTD